MSWATIIYQKCAQIAGVAASSINTNIVCQVVSYDADANTCSLQPVVKVMRADDPENMGTMELPQLDNIPVKHQGSGKFLVSVAPAVGSYGNLVVSDSSLENWIVEGGIVNPARTRRHHPNDGFFEPGLYPQKEDGDNGKLQSPIKTDRVSLRTRAGDVEISILDDNSVLIETTAAVNMVCSSAAIGSDLDVDGGVVANGDVVATNPALATVSLLNHVHAGPGSPPTPVPPTP
jgi:hypothetical protein